MFLDVHNYLCDSNLEECAIFSHIFDIRELEKLCWNWYYIESNNLGQCGIFCLQIWHSGIKTLFDLLLPFQFCQVDPLFGPKLDPLLLLELLEFPENLPDDPLLNLGMLLNLPLLATIVLITPLMLKSSIPLKLRQIGL